LTAKIGQYLRLWIHIQVTIMYRMAILDGLDILPKVSEFLAAELKALTLNV
jgi:hypothetical protein